MQELSFNKGDVIIREGSVGTSAFIIQQGRVKVVRYAGDNEIILSILGKGQIFGEQGLIEDCPRSASVIAMESCVLKELDRDDFFKAFTKDASVIIPIMKVLFERLRQMNDLVLQREEKVFRKSDFSPGKSPNGIVYLEGVSDSAKESLGDKPLKIETFPFKVGREHQNAQEDVFVDNDLYLKDHPPYTISRNHFSINIHKSTYYILDRGSHLGTVVNGKKIGVKTETHRAELRNGKNSLIPGGSSRFKFRVIVE